LVFLRRSRVDPARPPGSGRAWSGLAPGSVSLLLSAGPVVGPRATESRAAARSATNVQKRSRCSSSCWRSRSEASKTLMS